jgi:transcriptional antiterminator NusG
MTETEQNLEVTEGSTPQAEEVTEEVSQDETTEVSVGDTPEAETEEVPEVAAEETSEATPKIETETATDSVAQNISYSDAVDENNKLATEVIRTDVEEIPPTDEPRTQEGMNWFVLRVASNKEDFVRNALEKKVQIEAVQHLVGRIMVPTEKTKTLTKTGKTRISETKLYPGYIFVEMKLVDTRISQDVFFLIKETTGVGDFVGTAGKPTPMSDEEVDKMLYDSQAPEEVTEVKLEFAKGDHVNVKDGPFMGYEGTVDDIFPEKGVVRVLATVFGRQTQIDIEYWMIEKAE